MKDKTEKKKKQIRDVIEDMAGTDGMIMLKLGHQHKMRGFIEGAEKGGVESPDQGRDSGQTVKERCRRKDEV